MELDAARALADFARLALLESGRKSGGSSGIWGNRGRRSRKRVEGELEVKEIGRRKKRNVESASRSKGLDLVQDSTVENKQLRKKSHKRRTARSINDEQYIELLSSAPQCSTSCVSSGGGRTKHQLTEAEKEAKRFRRVLANRESARQTIRRRQALCEELAKKAAELSKEKECMKLEMELIMKQYQLLKDTNKNLKEQIAKVVKPKEEERSETPKPISSSSGMPQPFLIYNNQTIAPFIWSPVVHPPNSIKAQPILLNTMVPACKLESSHEHGNTLSPPCYIMPCPWFFPVGNGLYSHPMDSFGFKQEASLVKPCGEESSPKTTGDMQNCQPSSSRKVLTEAKCVSDTTIRLAHCELNQLGCQPSGSSVTPASLKFSDTTKKFSDTTKMKCEDILHQDPPPKEQSVSCTSNHIAVGYSGNMKRHNSYQNIKIVDAAAATEARKRRKELSKMKSSGGKLRMKC